MLSSESLQEFINRYQTSEKNVVREYVQHLFLSSLYRLGSADKLLFKGGTALRFIFFSPRFSEDLDFTGHGIFRREEIDNLFIDALAELEKTGINVSYKEAKPTTGGYLGLIHYDIFNQFGDMKFEVSLRRGKRMKGELVTIISDFIPPYTLISLPQIDLVSGKNEALLARKKPRDYYDLYFILRHPQLNKFIAKPKLKIVWDNLKTCRIDFRRELSALLPASHHMVLKDFETLLKKEVMRYL